MYIFACPFILIGEVELENVPLRRDALRFVDTSLDVKNGLVGRVKLKIPSSLRSEPWSIIMEKVYVVVTPQSHDDYDEMQEDVVSQEIKNVTKSDFLITAGNGISIVVGSLTTLLSYFLIHGIF